jgi:selenocysteine-specific elongation factor
MTRPPGLLRAGVDPDVLMMICTAGHVDHGKTRLVRLLTGCNTDRLKEEQERGLTIELGFAPCVLGGNLCVGIVDVPGHEKFIKNMVAGVSGIDLTVLVIAADDGVMPQTVEHLQIMELLGVRHGMIALTKTDLVTPERVAQRIGEIGEFLTGTFLANAPICPVSSETGEGVFDFYEVLVREIKGLASTRRRGVFRMPIERSFAQKGFGTVVTGIPVAGTIKVGDQVEIVPGHHTGRIRGIQRFLRDASEGGCGQCLALNISEFGKAPPERGQVVCLPGYLKAATIFHLRVKAVPGLETPLRHGEQIKFHTGTIEESGRLHLLETATLSEAQSALATAVLAQPAAAAIHDRFIIRRPSPAMTVAGGEILAVTESAQRPRKQELLDRLKPYATVFDGLTPDTQAFVDASVAYFLRVTRPTGALIPDISRGVLLSVDDVSGSIPRLCAKGEVLALPGDWFVHPDAYAGFLETVTARIEHAKREEGALSLTLSDLQQGFDWPQPLWRRIKTDLQQRGLVTSRGEKVLLGGAVDGLGDADRRLMEGIVKVYEETGFQSPRPDEVPGMLEAPPAAVERLMQHLCNEGRLVRLNKNVVLGYDTFRRAQEMVVEIIQKQGVLDSADFKNHIGSTRKYALAILDYLDARKVTVRYDNDRRLAPNYQKNLL